MISVITGMLFAACQFLSQSWEARSVRCCDSLWDRIYDGARGHLVESFWHYVVVEYVVLALPNKGPRSRKWP